MRLIRDKKISLGELHQMSTKMPEKLVKAVVDIDQGVMIVDIGMHADAEAFFLQNGSKQENLWGIKLHPAAYDTLEWVEFDSMINLRPAQGNRSRSVESPIIQKKVREIVKKLVQK